LAVWSSCLWPVAVRGEELAVALSTTPDSTSSNAWPAGPCQARPRHSSRPTLLRALYCTPSDVRVRAFVRSRHLPRAVAQSTRSKMALNSRSVPPADVPKKNSRLAIAVPDDDRAPVPIAVAIFTHAKKLALRWYRLERFAVREGYPRRYRVRTAPEQRRGRDGSKADPVSTRRRSRVLESPT
jgi:hypothetical protein